MIEHELPIESDGEGRVFVSGLDHMEALIRFYFGEDPEDMDIDDFCRTWGQLEYALVLDEKLAKPDRTNREHLEELEDAESYMDN